eukprot:scaffold73149_cov36-Phaeocystis_antarctica.AAC.2
MNTTGPAGSMGGGGTAKRWSGCGGGGGISSEGLSLRGHGARGSLDRMHGTQGAGCGTQRGVRRQADAAGLTGSSGKPAPLGLRLRYEALSAVGGARLRFVPQHICLLRLLLPLLL